jgi:hypothetical protein
VFDLAESNLRNYVLVLQEFLTEFFATAQVPPQYLLTQMTNISGDALTAAESTLQSLIEDLQLTCGESHEQVLRLASRAAGGPSPESAEIVWGDPEAKSFTAIVDGMTKLVSAGFPRQAAFEMIPGATPQKVSGGWTCVPRKKQRTPCRRRHRASRRRRIRRCRCRVCRGRDLRSPRHPSSDPPQRVVRPRAAVNARKQFPTRKR